MAGTDNTDYTEEVSYYVKGAEKTENTTFIGDQILKTLRDFCSETWIWRETLTAIDVVDEEDEYTLSPGVTNCDVPKVHMVDWVKYKEDGADDDQYAFLTPWNIETEEVAGSTGISAGFVFTEGTAPQVFYVEPDETLVIKPIPDDEAAGTANMLVKCILTPALTATTAPTHIFNNWLEVVAKGVAARVMAMAGKKWYNPSLANFYRVEYLTGRNDEARAQRWMGKTRTKTHVRMHPGFSGGSRQGSNGVNF
jgi:hypothetical protein